MESREANGSTGQLSSGGSIGDGVGATGMHHSHSTPAGVDGVGGGSRTPPATPKKGGKMLAIRVQMLDDTVTIFQVQVNNTTLTLSKTLTLPHRRERHALRLIIHSHCGARCLGSFSTRANFSARSMF